MIRQHINGSVHLLSSNFHLDHLGRPVAATDGTGHPFWRSNAEPHGYDPGYSLAKTPYLQRTPAQPIEKTSYGSNENHLHQEQLVEPGTYGVQFYFEKLSLETGYDALHILSREQTGDELIHSFTGNHQTGLHGNPGPGQGFWGPVIPFIPKNMAMNASSSSPNAALLFQLLSDGSIEWEGYKITSYRLWHITSGTTGVIAQNDTPTQASGTYEANLGQGSTPPWQRTYTYPGGKLVRVCFQNFDLEFFWDRVEIRDASENIIQVLSGNLGSVCSAWVQGDTAKVYLYTDSSVENSGFVVTGLQVRSDVEVKARFPGQWYDKDTEAIDQTGAVWYAGLHYNWHRYYDPNVGRYLTPDPLGLAGGLNLYTYADNDPVNHIDRNGLYTSLHTKEGMAMMLMLGLSAPASVSTMKATVVACGAIAASAYMLPPNGPELGPQLVEAYHRVKNTIREYFRQRVLCDTIDTDGGGVPDAYYCGGVVHQVPTKLLPAPKGTSFIPNKLKPHEVLVVQEVLKFRGGHFVGSPKPNYPGIDGWLDGIPVQLKYRGGDSPTSVSNAVRLAGEKASNAGINGVDVYIVAQNVSAEAIFSGPIKNILNQQSSLSTVNILTKDGWVRIIR